MAKKSTSKPDPAVRAIEHAIQMDAGMSYIAGSGVLFIDDDEPAAEPSAPLDRNQQLSEILFWGAQNDYPQRVLLKALKSPRLLSLISMVAYFLYGGGLTYEVIDQTTTGSGRPKWVEGYDEEVEAWMQANNTNDYLLDEILDLVWFNHGFTEMIKNKRGDKVAQITHQEAAFARFSKQNDKGYNDTIYLNANWAQSNYKDSFTIPVPCINVKDINKVQTVKNADYDKFMFPVAFPTPGNLTYMSAAWHSLFESGHYDINILIPILKRALMKFTMTVKYMIKVPMAFWVNLAKDKGKDWETLSHDDKQLLKKELNKEMSEFLSGAENAGKSFVSTFGWDKQNNQEIPGITIVPIEDKLKDGVWLEDGQDTDATFIASFNLTPDVVGHFTGKGMGAGSGSGSRVQGNMINNLMLSRRHKILSPLDFVAQYNGWTTRLKGFRWKIREFQFDTLDVNHSTTNPKPAPDGGQPDQQ